MYAEAMINFASAPAIWAARTTARIDESDPSVPTTTVR
jgi:hypothetical protein